LARRARSVEECLTWLAEPPPPPIHKWIDLDQV
jgi:hypothetical protein